MTTTDDVLALAASAAPSDQAEADLAQFAAAAARGMNTPVVQALRTLRPGHAGPAALPESAAWHAWLSATAAIAGIADGARTDSARTVGSRETASDPTALFVVCAAATALGGDGPASHGGDSLASDGGDGPAAALVESRLAGLADPAGWSLPAVSAVIGAGLAAGLMLRLTPGRLRHALGICATQAAGLRAATNTDAGPLQAGKAAFNAVEAGQLARLGFTSSGDPLDGRRALFALFAR
jgi:hypothetical protein